MSDKAETLAAILAEMHAELDCFDDTKVIPVVYIKNRLPRIEAAAEREQASLEDALSHCKQYAQKIERENEEGETRLDAEEIIATVDNEFAGIRPERAPGNAAVNERDRIRDIVRRLLPLAETTVENIRALGAARFPFEEQIKSDRLRGDINREVSNADHLLREARAAIGAGETPTGKGVGR